MPHVANILSWCTGPLVNMKHPLSPTLLMTCQLLKGGASMQKARLISLYCTIFGFLVPYVLEDLVSLNPSFVSLATRDFQKLC